MTIRKLSGSSLAICVVATVWLLFPVTTSAAVSWEGFFQKISPNDTIVSGATRTGTAYNANYTFTITDGDANPSNFATGDTIDVNFTNVETASVVGITGASPVQLEQWARNNAPALMRALFTMTPDTGITGQPASSFFALRGMERIFETLDAALEESDGKRSGGRTGMFEFGAGHERYNYGPKQNRVTGNSAFLGYASRGRGPLAHNWGVDVDYRGMAVDDEFGSDVAYMSLAPFYHPTRAVGKYKMTMAAGLTGSSNYLESDLFADDGGGMVQYGGMAGSGLGRNFMPDFAGRFGLGYQYLDRHIPTDDLSEDMKWVAEAVNDAPPDEVLTTSFGVHYWFKKDILKTELNYHWINQIGQEIPDAYKEQKVISLITTFITHGWRGKATLSMATGIDGVEDHYSLKVSALPVLK